MRAELSRLEIAGPEALLAGARQAEADLRAAGRIVGEVVLTATDATELTVTAELAPTDA